MTDVTIRTDFQLGQRASFGKTITESDVTTFAGLIGDFNPLHVDAEYARQSRFGRRVAHGMFTAGLISAVLGNKLPGPGSIYLSQQIEFLAPVYIGDTITAAVEVVSWRPEKGIITLKTDCYNQDEKQIVTGKAVLLVNRPDR
ncbi:MAG: enoyl-CoA hydratase [Anaerolineaceae bacterium 4572_32.1]|nr:MAG: enoyl-CoA hydratase [Anaerolineaceae bacterium 4572_32.1]